MDPRILTVIERGGAVLTVNRRIARVLQGEFARLRVQSARTSAATTVWERPEILPLNAWLRESWTRFATTTERDVPMLLSEVQEAAIWEQIIAESAGARPIRVDAIAKLAAEAWALAATYRIPGDRLTGNADVEEFAHWADEFRQVKRKNGWLDSAHLPDEVGRAIAAKEIPAPKDVVLCGFDAITPQLQDLVKVLESATANVVLADTAYDTREPVTPVVRRVGLPGNRDEIILAARWARRVLEEKGASAGSIGVIIPELTPERDLVERTFSDILHPEHALPGANRDKRVFNITLGKPLSKEPVVSAALALLRLVCQPLQIDEVSWLLRSPFLNGGRTELVSRSILDRELRDCSHAEVDIAVLVRMAQKSRGGMPEFLAALRRLVKEKAKLAVQSSASGWANVFSDVLQAAGWPDLANNTSREFQAVKSFRKALSALASLDLVGEPLSFDEALSAVRQIVDDQLFQPEGSAAPVQIMGLLEAKAMKFDHVWVAHLHNGAWPRSSNPNPFIPAAEQRRLKIPRCSPDAELEFAREWMKRLLSTCPDVVFSYPLVENDRELRPSALIEEYDAIAPAELVPGACETYVGVLAKEHASAMETTPLNDGIAPSVAPDEHVRGGTYLFQKQARCPFSAYARFRLGAEALRAPSPGFGAMDRGTLVHKVLDLAWSELVTKSALEQKSDEELERLIRDCAAKAIAGYVEEKGRAIAEEYCQLEQDRLVSLVIEWMKLELTREGDFTVEKVESEFEDEFAGVKIKMRMDRLDRVDGGLVAIDYKTGEATPGKWFTDRPEEPQLPMYCVLNKAEIVGAYFALVSPGASCFKGGGVVEGKRMAIKSKRTDKFFENWEQCVRNWEAVLQNLGDQIRGGVAIADPKRKDICRSCDFRYMCRIDESDAGASLAAEAAEEVANCD